MNNPNEQIKRAILDKIKAYDRIILSRHIRPDGDAVGATLGLFHVLRASFPQKEVLLDNEDYSEYMAFLGDEGRRPTEGEYENALLIVLDTGTLDRVSNSRATLAREIVKIDHHIIDKPYGDLVLVEEERSSVCEMIADFCLTFPSELLLTRKAAECLYCGMVTDSGRFRFRGTGPETLRCAAALLECGIDTETLYANLYMEDLEVLHRRAELVSKIRMTENGVAWLDLPYDLQLAYGWSREEASNVVSLMEKIKGSLIWLAFIDNGDGSTRVRLRSRFVTVQELASRFHGGGHACASGATVCSKEEHDALLADADALLGAFKKDHGGLL